MEFILEDSAPKVKPEAIRPRSLDDIRPGGLGTFFIHSYMDKCTFDEQFTQGQSVDYGEIPSAKGLHQQ